MKRYQVTLSAEMNVTADDREEAIRNCDSDVREFVAQNRDLEVEDVGEVDAATHDLTESLDEIQFQESELVEEADEDREDWVMKGVYSVIVDAEDEKQAIEIAKALPSKLAEDDEEHQARWAVTLTAQICVTAEDRDQAIRNCDEDAREFVAQNDMLKVKHVRPADAEHEDLTESLEEIQFQRSEVVRAAAEGSVDWTLNGVYTVVVDADTEAEAIEIAKALPKKLAAEAETAAAPSM